jgi:hypothetical protein
MAEPQRGLEARHIHIRHFWIKDRAKAEGIQIRHCPTLEMLGDFLPNHFRVHYSGRSAM